MKLGQYIARPFTIQAVRLTDENFDEVLAWSDGTQDLSDEGHTFIRLDVKKPLGPRQTKAYVGDWVLKAKSGVKTYTNEAFRRAFIPKHSNTADKVINMTVNNMTYSNTPAVEEAKDSPRIDATVVPDTSPRLQVEDEGTDSPPVQV